LIFFLYICEMQIEIWNIVFLHEWKTPHRIFQLNQSNLWGLKGLLWVSLCSFLHFSPCICCTVNPENILLNQWESRFVCLGQLFRSGEKKKSGWQMSSLIMIVVLIAIVVSVNTLRVFSYTSSTSAYWKYFKLHMHRLVRQQNRLAFSVSRRKYTKTLMF
jgi:hypothetical protein